MKPMKPVPPGCVSARDVAHRRAGFVLPAAIIALVVMSALIAGATFVSTEELRAGRADVASQRAFAAAEVALERAIARWRSELTLQMRPGETRIVSTAGDSRGDSAMVTATRVNDRAFWLVARGTSRADGRPIPARTTIGGSMRLLVPTLPLAAALTVGGTVYVDGGTVAGGDAGAAVTDPLSCPSVAPRDAAGIIAPDSTRVCGAECGTGAPGGVTGNPPVAAGARLTSDSASGPDGWTSLASRATMTLAGGELSPRPAVSDGACDGADPLNWGDPGGGSGCRDHMPVIRVTGNALLAAGSVGQGVLLVDGSLTVAAGARFSGVVIVRNDVTVVGAGAALDGVVIALDGDAAGASVVRDGGAARFARCAAQRALLSASRLVRTPERWWVELR